MAARYAAAELIRFAAGLLDAAGLEPDKSRAVAGVLVEGDLLGHTTHGLQLLAPYLEELAHGRMEKSGEPVVLSRAVAAVTWDGRRLPGPWLTTRAIDLALDLARTLGIGCVSIRRSHHLACLAAYLRRVTEEGMMILLTCSDPSGRGVAPHGGVREVYTPNPLAAAWPTRGDPVMIDVSMSITTNGMNKRLQAEGRKLPGSWLIDHQGRLSDDPRVVFEQPPGAILPLGGLDHGHKGFALGLLVEALTSGLSGHGRADPPEGWSANVFVLVLDPKFFGGAEHFIRQTTWLANACRGTPPRPGVDRVRLPGERGQALRRAQLRDGVELYPGIIDSMNAWAARLRMPAIAPLPV